MWEGQLRTNADPQGEQPAGDSSVAYIVAHEYAHSLQGELGLLPTVQDLTLKFPVYKTELHADCWAGVWANSAYHKAILEPGDIEEAARTTKDVGDYQVDHPKHHGTPQQRAEAFMAGYNAGDPRSCDPYLLGQY